MFFFPPTVTQYTKDGEKIAVWVDADYKNSKMALIRRWGANLGPGMLCLGFLFQLAAIWFS